MALINCPKCGHSVSSLSPDCPNCGYVFAGGSSTGQGNQQPINNQQPQHTGGFCSNCGARLDPGSNFCPNCGTKMGYNGGSFGRQGSSSQQPVGNMDFGKAIETCFKKYVCFDGRASMAEFWWFFLFCFIIDIISGWIPFAGWIVWLAIFLPYWAVKVRRMHDVNKSGWCAIVPFYGIILCFFESINEGNQYNC